MVTCCITGSNGFIGQHLVKRLQKDGVNLINLTHDVLEDGNEVRKIFINYKPQIVYNLQAYGNHSTQLDDYDAIRSNIVFTHNLALIARDTGVQTFVQFGSSSEYGRKMEPMKETDVLEPVTMYGATKSAATTMTLSMQTPQFKVVIIRPFSVYGPGEADFRFIPTIVRCLQNKEVLTLDSMAVHDWIYIDDFVDGVLLATQSKENIVNIGTGVQLANIQIYRFISKIMGKSTKIKEKHLRSFDGSSWVADNTRLKSLGWLPKHDIIDGLKHTIAYYVS